jgi:hypothetical protein
MEVEALARCFRYCSWRRSTPFEHDVHFRVCIVVYSGKDHDPVQCQHGPRKIMLSLIGYQFDRVITEERRRLLGIVQGEQRSRSTTGKRVGRFSFLPF